MKCKRGDDDMRVKFTVYRGHLFINLHHKCLRIRRCVFLLVLPPVKTHNYVLRSFLNTKFYRHFVFTKQTSIIHFPGRMVGNFYLFVRAENKLRFKADSNLEPVR